MSRRATGKGEVAVTLFPFLAVLICTMGSLIVLLVVVVQQAKHLASQPETIAAVPVHEAAPDEKVPVDPVATFSAPLPPFAAPPIEVDPSIQLEDQVADVQWANEQLAASRERTRLQVEESRHNLSRLEDQTRRLGEQLDLLEKQASDLLAAEEGSSTPDQISESDIEQVRQSIADAKSELRQRKENAEQVGKPQFALVAYDGQNGTKRRPVYIECTSEGATLQPEGIRLTVDDLRIPGPTNALSASLRITREYLSDAGVTQIAGEPYPLIVVRPGGETAFVASRRALKGWDEDWGYELIPSDMELAFPEPDQALQRLLGTTIAQIRNATASQLAAIRRAEASMRRGGPSSEGYRIGQTAGSGLIQRGRGGIHADGSRPAGGGSNFGGSAGGGAGAGTSSMSNGFGGRGAKQSLPGGDNLQPSIAKVAGAGGDTSNFGTEGRIPNSIPGSGMGAAADQNNLTAGEQGSYESGPGGNNGPGGRDGRPGGQMASSSHRGSAFQSGQNSASHGSPRNGNVGHGGQASAGQQNGSNASRASSYQASGGSGGSSGQPSAAMSSPLASGGQPSMNAPTEQGASPSLTFNMNSIAASQGSNWALPDAQNGGIGITRPLQIYCGSDRISVLPEAGTSNTRSTNIPCNSDFRESIDPLVSTIWKRIEQWGIAGPNVYWKPILQVSVEPGAESRFEEMRVLLDGSGLEVQRSN